MLTRRLAALLALLLVALLAAGTQLPSVSICVAIKDQAVDVREWITYHRAIGERPHNSQFLIPACAPLRGRLRRCCVLCLECRGIQVLHLGHGQQAAARGE